MLSNLGARVVTHSFLPEACLAKELQMCYAAVCYVVDYAETGSRYQPLGVGELFGAVEESSAAQRVSQVLAAMGPVTDALASQAASLTGQCGCRAPMDQKIAQYELSDDWHEWLQLGS
jgi:5'-methylthioadenosine phosphorylase